MNLYIVGRRNGCPGVYSAYLVSICPSLFLPVSQFFSNKCYYRCILGHRQVSHNTSGMVSTANGNSPLAELSPWCEFLLINFELPEVSPRLPVVECLLRQLLFVASNMQRMHSFRLVDRLRTEHSSIKFVRLCESRVSQGNLLLLNGLQMGCDLGHVTVALLFDHPIDEICSAVTMLDTLETVSVLFSSVAMHTLFKILRSCEADTAYLSAPRTCLSAVPACACLSSGCYCHGHFLAHAAFGAYRSNARWAKESCAQLNRRGQRLLPACGALPLERTPLDQLSATCCYYRKTGLSTPARVRGSRSLQQAAQALGRRDPQAAHEEPIGWLRTWQHRVLFRCCPNSSRSI
ncbi:hypothetical protein HPB50_002359 [Hyalomma asiaticum]|uniref:Uncharacterized protein n=1 Tax=Hyalomma asiaticum TaxID=266040 RepID=A0ACB7THB6_HYAAI|nr:hypothetical protein HPB50_002359 [Hyalomma asiaticum]